MHERTRNAVVARNAAPCRAPTTTGVVVRDGKNVRLKAKERAFATTRRRDGRVAPSRLQLIRCENKTRSARFVFERELEELEIQS